VITRVPGKENPFANVMFRGKQIRRRKTYREGETARTLRNLRVRAVRLKFLFFSRLPVAHRSWVHPTRQLFDSRDLGLCQRAHCSIAA
jgi:hypothetical protein